MEALLQQRGATRVADCGARLVPAAALISRAGCSVLHVKSDVKMTLGCVRFVGIGSRREGSRGVRYLQAARDGRAPENAESGAREQFQEQAKAESASTIDEEQEPFRNAVESGQTIGEATTELQFGENDRKSASKAITHASKELFEQSKTNGKPDPTKEEDPETKKEEVSSDVWGSKEERGNTHAFLDDSEKVSFHGEDDESVLGIGGQRAGESQM